MNPITIIEGDDLSDLLELVASAEKRGCYRIRVHQAPDGDGIKVKINEGMWTYLIGSADR